MECTYLGITGVPLAWRACPGQGKTTITQQRSATAAVALFLQYQGKTVVLPVLSHMAPLRYIAKRQEMYTAKRILKRLGLFVIFFFFLHLYGLVFI